MPIDHEKYIYCFAGNKKEKIRKLLLLYKMLTDYI